MPKHTPRHLTTITTPFAFFAWLLERLAEGKPRVRIDAASYQRFQRTLETVRGLEGECIPPNLILTELYLKKAKRCDIAVVKCGRDLPQTLDTLGNLVWHGGRDVEVSIESCVMIELMHWPEDPEHVFRLSFKRDRVRIRSRKACIKRFGVLIDVDMDADCLG